MKIKRLIVIMISEFSIANLDFDANEFFASDRVWGKEFIKLSYDYYCTWWLTIGIGVFLFHFLHSDLVILKY